MNIRKTLTNLAKFAPSKLLSSSSVIRPFNNKVFAYDPDTGNIQLPSRNGDVK